MTESYDFNERLAMSQGVAHSLDVGDILMSCISGALKVTQADTRDDRNGTDWWVEHASGNKISVDAKIRTKDYWTLRREDDLALEVWSIKARVSRDSTRSDDNRVVGWTLNENKRTDYILWFWLDSQRFCLMPFHMLCRVFQRHNRAWYDDYEHCEQFTPRTKGATDGYFSECVFVPRHEVWAAIYRMFGGAPRVSSVG